MKETSQNTASLNVLKNILNGMDAYIYVSDPKTDKIMFINDKMKEQFALTGEPVGEFCWRLLQSDFDRKCDFCPNSKLLLDPDTPVIWEEHNTVTGRYYMNVDRIIEWPDGSKVHIQHSTDITERKLTEASLEKRLKQQELMSAISQGFIKYDDMAAFIKNALQMAGEFMSVNQVFLSEYQEDQYKLNCLYEWCDEKALPFIGGAGSWSMTPDMQIYDNLLNKGYYIVDDFDYNMHPNFGAVKEYNTMNAFLNIPIEVSGNIWGVLGFVIYGRTYHWTDSDMYLGKHIGSILSGVISRQIMREHLIEAKEMAEQASSAKGEFLSRMSHEIRTPMNAIIGMTNIAKNSPDPAKKEYCLGKIDNASKHLLGVINDILDMSKIEANKFELSYNEFDLEKVLMDITDVVILRAEDKNQNLIVNLHKAIPRSIIGDEQRLGQVVTNLLTNAVKFTPEGGNIILNVSSMGESEGGCTLQIEVIDDGIGISEEQQSRLFHSFEQADGGISRKYGGTGLGLAISKRIVNMMGGRIWVESSSDHGSKFAFTVEVQKGKAQPQTKLVSGMSRENVHILAVDDSPETRDYFLHVMEMFDLPCDVAADGREALSMIESCKEKPYNIFFVDWQMPKMNGIELTRKIKELNHDNAVIIMISVAEWSDIKENATAAGVNRFISKPLFPSILVNSINECLGVPAKGKTALRQVEAPDNRDVFKDYTLLLAEDMEINREIVMEILSDTGVTIEFAENGLGALEMFKAHPDRYSLILMDVHMPEMDGYEATRSIRALDLANADRVPIVAMTANVFREDIERCLASGMDDHIGKPVDAGKLFDKLRKYLIPRAATVKSDADCRPDRTGGPEKQLFSPDYAEFLPVIDVPDGLRRMMNNKMLYFKLLSNFLVKQMADKLIENITNEDYSQIAQTAHALKGTSANLGLIELKDIASNIEERAKMEMDCTDLVAQLDKAVAVVISSIDLLLAGEGVKH